MAQNLRTTKYRIGDPIPNINDGGTPEGYFWSSSRVGEGAAIWWEIVDSRSNLFTNSNSQKWGFSVRCIRD